MPYAIDCLCRAGGPHHPSCHTRLSVGRDLATATGLDALRRGLRTLTARRPVHVRKIDVWWVWCCQLPGCLDFGPRAYRDPGRAADAGREHHRLWHTDS